LEEKIIAYRILQTRLDALLKQRNLLTGRLVELQTTLSSIKEVERSKKALFQIGSGAWKEGQIIPKGKLIVEVGAGIALEKTPQEAEIILKRRVAEVQRALRTVQQAIATTTAELERLGPEIRVLAEKRVRAG